MPTDEDRAFQDEAIELARNLWRAYLIDQSQAGDAYIADALEVDNLSVIGTGRHEFCSTAAQFFENLGNDRSEAADVAFEILDEYYEARVIDPEVCLVFGTLWVRELPKEPKLLLVEMDTRFSILVHRVDGKPKIVHLHHSTPNADQKLNEFYPKTATERANAALEYSRELERRADLDSMTGLLNRMAFERTVEERLACGIPDAVLFMIDLDNFKSVNDTLGHLAGDRVIMDFAAELKNVFLRDAVIGRMGGDEFAVLVCDRASAEQAAASAGLLIERWGRRGGNGSSPLSCSIGMAKVGGTRDFRVLYRAADEALYESKRNGKGRYAWFERDILPS